MVVEDKVREMVLMSGLAGEVQCPNSKTGLFGGGSEDLNDGEHCRLRESEGVFVILDNGLGPVEKGEPRHA